MTCWNTEIPDILSPEMTSYCFTFGYYCFSKKHSEIRENPFQSLTLFGVILVFYFSATLRARELLTDAACWWAAELSEGTALLA